MHFPLSRLPLDSNSRNKMKKYLEHEIKSDLKVFNAL